MKMCLSSWESARLATSVPALRTFFEFAFRRAAGVVVEVEEPGVALLPVLHSGVAAHFAVPLREALGSLEAQRLPHRYLAAVGETLQGGKGKRGQQEFRAALDGLMDCRLRSFQLWFSCSAAHDILSEFVISCRGAQIHCRSSKADVAAS